jgi:hypothetical protein
MINFPDFSLSLVKFLVSWNDLKTVLGENMIALILQKKISFQFPLFCYCENFEYISTIKSIEFKLSSKSNKKRGRTQSGSTFFYG